MFPLKIIFFIIVASSGASAKCRQLSVRGFENAVVENGIQVFINKDKTATLAVRCQESSVSDQEALHEFSKTGSYVRVGEKTYSNERQLSGVLSKNYLQVGDSLYQVSLLVNSKNAEVSSLEKAVEEALVKLL